MQHNIPQWLKDAVFYQIYPQSYYDSNKDGIGDINGIIEKLDYIQSLGVNALWLNPCFVSPFQDAGYDVADYYQVAPRYGTNKDLVRLFAEAHKRGIKVCLDLVPGHTSVEHSWFIESCKHHRNDFSDRYIWSESVWEEYQGPLRFINGFAERNGNYVTNFFYCQPALNYGFANPDPDKPWQQRVDAPGPVKNRQALKDIMDFWLKQGADGFRVDMAGSLVKNDTDHKLTIQLWQDISKWLQKQYPQAVLISEWGNPQEAISAGFHIDFMLHFGVSGYEHLLLSKDCFFRRNNGTGIQRFLEAYLHQVSNTTGHGYVSIPSANHDFKRVRSDGRSIEDLKVIFTFLLTWPGIPFIYYGDEIGMRFFKDMPSKEGGYDRTGTRTPMQWSDGLNAGFSKAGPDQLYLPVDPDDGRPDVMSQENDQQSLLNHVRKLLSLRKNSQALQSDGKLVSLYYKKEQSPYVYIREQEEEKFLIAVNPSDKEFEITVDQDLTHDVICEIASGVDVFTEKNGLKIKLSGVSYGIFRLH